MGVAALILLDTHVWVWWVNGSSELSTAAREAIDAALRRRQIHISSISAWEVTLLASRGRLQLTLDPAEWIERSASLPFVRFVPVDNAIAIRSVQLPGALHHDPADRIIAATALTLDLTLVTRDRRLRAYPHLRTLW